MSTTRPLDKVLVVVPTYNDSRLLRDISAEIIALSDAYRVLIVDDGSMEPVDVDSLPDGLMLFRLPANFGLGLCTHVAFDHALKHGYAAVVRIDADGQHPVQEIPRLLEQLQSEADLVVGTRTNRNAGTGLRAWFAIWVRGYLSWAAKVVTRGCAPRDVNSGFFAANATAMRLLNKYRLERYPEPQIYILSCRRGLRLKELNIEQRERQYGSSTLTVTHALRLFYRFNIFITAEMLQGSRTE